MCSLIMVGVLSAADAAATPEATPASAASAQAPDPDRPSLVRAEGMVTLDYQLIPIRGDRPIDLMGFHVLNRVAEGLYLGIGGFAPLFKGEYGGFMAYDVTAHAQRRIRGHLFAAAGLAIGGGGGGKSVQQSKELSGTGGFVKGYVGLGYDFADFSVGANVARIKFKGSSIDDTRINAFVQVPFSYVVGPYASRGDAVGASSVPADAADSSEYTLTLGADNFSQIDPVGSYKGTIRVVDLQLAHYLSRSTYWYASFGVGYRGLPTYNQIIGGLGHRLRLGSRLDLLAQLGIGSGGYAPEKFDTGTGLLIAPKAGVELALTRRLGLVLSAGYLLAPEGTSKNLTYGAALSYHVRPQRDATGSRERAEDAWLRGHRFSLFSQAGSHIRYRDIDRPSIQLASLQFDSIVSDHFYVPVQAAVATNAYLGYPGYGEVLAGLGLQSRHRKGERFEFFGQLLGGTNVHGPIVKASVGVNLGLSDQLAIHASASKARATSSKDGDFRADYAALGIAWRFSLPGW